MDTSITLVTSGAPYRLAHKTKSKEDRSSSWKLGNGMGHRSTVHIHTSTEYLWSHGVGYLTCLPVPGTATVYPLFKYVLY